MAQDDQALASHLARRLAQARASLKEEMAAAGMLAKDGWRIAEQVRHTVLGTDFIFSPIHTRFTRPGLERRVCIDHEGRPREE
jgi:hypothetical protein